MCLPFLVGAIEYTVCTGICFRFITAIFFAITIVIIQSFHGYRFARLNAEE